MVSVHWILKELLVSPNVVIILIDISIVLCLISFFMGMIYGIIVCYRRYSYMNTRVNENVVDENGTDETVRDEIKSYLHQQLDDLELKLEHGMTDMDYMIEIRELHNIYRVIERGYFS